MKTHTVNAVLATLAITLAPALLHAGDLKVEGSLQVTEDATVTSDAELYVGSSDSLENVNGVVFEGQLGQGSHPGEGDGVVMFWYPAKAAFRAGSSVLGNWTDINIGLFSAAFGKGVATNTYSFSAGEFPVAYGTHSVAFGKDSIAYNYSIAAGNGSQAVGSYAAAFGGSGADGDYSLAVGGSAATGSHAISLGGSYAGGDYSVALGNSYASGNYSITSGSSQATSSHSVALGEALAEAPYSVALGQGVAYAPYSVALGKADADADSSVSAGTGVTTYSFGSIALGTYNAPNPNPVSSSSWTSTDELLIVGNGASSEASSNALLIKKNANARMAGDLEVKGKVRVPESGDLSMGNFTSSPAGMEDPALLDQGLYDYDTP